VYEQAEAIRFLPNATFTREQICRRQHQSLIQPAHRLSAAYAIPPALSPAPWWHSMDNMAGPHRSGYGNDYLSRASEDKHQILQQLSSHSRSWLPAVF
jgi:hypothetical protein